jgi:hypothetical protein
MGYYKEAVRGLASGGKNGKGRDPGVGNMLYKKDQIHTASAI